MSTNTGSRENIKVICRVRPLNEREKNSGKGTCITNTRDSLKLCVESQGEKKSGEEGNYDFAYDRVFGPETQQFEVFDYAAKPIIEGALEGWNGTLFCYGQTSSGKTHTMEGVHGVNELRGVVPRMMEYVFELIKNANVDLEFSVKCSFLEIYNEKIQDLLDPRKNNLMVKEEKSKGIWVDDATEIYVTSKEEMHDVFKIGSENRSVGATQMNAKSSRSHSLFIVTIFQKNNKTDSTKTGKLYFVDLAGSERMAKTGIEGGQMLEEAKNINKSLMMLGMVINALTEGRTHVPYRDSKLTRVLQESLGGNSQTTLIINCSPCAINSSESLSTLRFGQRAKSIKNKIVVNTERSAKELLLKLNEAEEKIKQFQTIINELQNGRGDILLLNTLDANNKANSHANENRNQAPSQSSSNTKTGKNCEDCSNAMRQLLSQHIEVVTLQEELESARKDKLELEDEIAARNHDLYELNERALLSELKAKLFIEDELKSFQELQMRLEHLFLFNQNKLLQTNKIRNILEKTRYEVVILMKSNKLKLDKTQFEGLSDELVRYNKNLEESLEVLNKIEEYIITDNKSFNELVDFFSGKNFENNNQPNTDYLDRLNQESSNTVNNINLNINKNININIIKKEKREPKRRNSISFIRTESTSNTNSSKSVKFINIYNSCVPKASKKSRNSQDSSLSINNITPVNYGDPEEEPAKETQNLSGNYSSNNNFKKVLKCQRRTIRNLASQFKSIEETLSSVKRDNIEKELILNQNTENFLQTEVKVKECELTIKELSDKLAQKEGEFEDYKTKTMTDFVYKEKKIVELINKVGDLEDENYKLIHFNKDKDKKKYCIVERQVKQLTNEMQKLIAENEQLKGTVEKKDEDIKNLNSKISDLENSLVQSVKHKMNEISFAGNGPELQSGICTPVTTYLNAKGFQCSSLSDILEAKLKNLNSISPHSVGRRNSENSVNLNGNSAEGSQKKAPNSNNKLYHININTNHMNSYNQYNSPLSNNGNKIMRVIRGGGGQDYNSTKNFFFSKMLNSGKEVPLTTKHQKSLSRKFTLNKLKKEKFEQELKFIDNDDDLNNSRDSQSIETIDIQQVTTRVITPQKDKGGLFNFFSKIISK